MTDVEGIILAAGFSKRAKTCKMTLDLGGKTVLESCIDGMYSVCSKVYVVGGYRVDEIVPVIRGYPRVELVINENYEEGMFSSVKKGLKYIKGDYFFLTPGDYPLISTEVYKSMLKDREDIIIPSFKGAAGHPALIKSLLIPEILYNPTYVSLREFIGAKGFKKIEVSDKGILMDIDTPEDYIKIMDIIYKNTETNPLS